jgi:hypothetical protein
VGGEHTDREENQQTLCNFSTGKHKQKRNLQRSKKNPFKVRQGKDEKQKSRERRKLDDKLNQIFCVFLCLERSAEQTQTRERRK